MKTKTSKSCSYSTFIMYTFLSKGGKIIFLITLILIYVWVERCVNQLYIFEVAFAFNYQICGIKLIQVSVPHWVGTTALNPGVHLLNFFYL